MTLALKVLLYYNVSSVPKSLDQFLFEEETYSTVPSHKKLLEKNALP